MIKMSARVISRARRCATWERAVVACPSTDVYDDVYDDDVYDGAHVLEVLTMVTVKPNADVLAVSNSMSTYMERER